MMVVGFKPLDVHLLGQLDLLLRPGDHLHSTCSYKVACHHLIDHLVAWYLVVFFLNNVIRILVIIGLSILGECVKPLILVSDLGRVVDPPRLQLVVYLFAPVVGLGGVWTVMCLSLSQSLVLKSS